MGALKRKCTDFLKKTLKVNNLIAILDQALFYNEDSLVDFCMDFLTKNTVKSFKSLENHHCNIDTLKLIVGCKKLQIDEKSIFELCNSWATVECKAKDMPANGENKREVLGPVLKEIRFVDMSSEEIACVVAPSGLLTLQEEVDVYRYLNGSKQAGTISQLEPRNAARRAKLSEHYLMFPAGFSAKKKASVGWVEYANHSFQVQLSCSKESTLLGFSFAQTGYFRISLNGTDQFEGQVSHVGQKVYLVRPFVFKNELHIKDLSTQRCCPYLGDVYHICGYCKSGTTLSVRRSEGVPFDGLMLSYSKCFTSNRL